MILVLRMFSGMELLCRIFLWKWCRLKCGFSVVFVVLCSFIIFSLFRLLVRVCLGRVMNCLILVVVLLIGRLVVLIR